jgi:hypothetical protein
MRLEIGATNPQGSVGWSATSPQGSVGWSAAPTERAGDVLSLRVSRDQHSSKADVAIVQMLANFGVDEAVADELAGNWPEIVRHWCAALAYTRTYARGRAACRNPAGFLVAMIRLKAVGDSRGDYPSAYVAAVVRREAEERQQASDDQRRREDRERGMTIAPPDVTRAGLPAHLQQRLREGATP